MKQINAMLSRAPRIEFKDYVLTIAVKSGDLGKVRAVLDAGAFVGYMRPHSYDVLIDATCCRCDSELLQILSLLIEKGAPLNTVSSYGESALKIVARNGRFDVVALLLNAGAEAETLQWTPLMRAVALGSVAEVESELWKKSDTTARDFCERTAWLLSLKTGNVTKAKLLLNAGANRTDRGRCGETALMTALGHTEMIRWLLDEGFDPNELNDFKHSPLGLASASGDVPCVELLVAAGANIHHVYNGSSPINEATSPIVVRILVANGADLNEISNEMRAALTKLPQDGKVRCSFADYEAAKKPRFGKCNPEKMDVPFWKSMIRSGGNAYFARKHFNDDGIRDGPVWCFERFGKSINLLPDGRIIEIAGEHEDHYDPDFNIYNDVVVHHGDGNFDIYAYPKDIFPPTDFHSATVVGLCIYIIGNMGYPEDRRAGATPVFKLDTNTLAIDAVTTTGTSPGWISMRKAKSLFRAVRLEPQTTKTT